MIRFLTYGLVAACLVGVLGAAGQPQPTFRGKTDIVRVFVTVTDRDGRLVTTLTRDDFQVRDDGKPQSISTFDNTPRPIRLIILLDVSGSMSGNLPLLRAAAEELFVRLRPDDAARVGAFGHEVTISSAFTRDLHELRAALPDTIDPDAPTPLWRAINDGLNLFRQDAEERPVILVLSDGKDSGPTGFNQRYVSQVDIIDRARQDGVMIYAIGMRSRGRPQGPPGIGPGGLQAMLLRDMPDPGLARVAQETGGGYTEIRFGEDLGAAFARVADELHSQYLLGYPPPKHDGKRHDIDVRLSQRGLEARARKSYVAAKD